MSELKAETQEGGSMKMSKPKFEKFKSKESNEPIKVDLSKPVEKTEPDIIKVDLTKKPETDAIPIGETKKVDVGEQAGDGEIVDIGGEQSAEESSTPIEEITELGEKQISTPEVKVEPEVNLPKNIEKLITFMKETGGTIDDYTRLNADYSSVDENTLLKEYYKNTKPHLTSEDLTFIMEENFDFDEELDEERDIRRKKLAKKEEVAKAKKHLEDLKVKYYDEIKLRPTVNQDEKKALDFFNRYNKDQELAKQKHSRFLNNTKQLLNDEFKGFDFEVGEKKFKDTKGYHKAMYAAQNVDKIVSHFYEQGKTDGIKTVMESSKNPSSDGPRQTASDGIFVHGLKVRAIDGVDSSKLKIKVKNKI